MTDQLDLFPMEAFTDRYYFNPTSTRTKRPIKRALTRQREAPQTSTNQVNQGT